jgi:hypothetical protein
MTEVLRRCRLASIADAPVSRIYDLVQQRKLTPCRDGRRLLFTTAELRR